MKTQLTKKFFASTISIATVYVVVTIYLMNIALVRDTLMGTHSFRYRWDLLTALLGGMWTAMTMMGLTTLIIVAILTGATLSLIINRVRTIRSSGGAHLVIGGGSLVGIVGSGCASCGLPVLAFLGLSGAAAYLPFQGMELSLIAIVLLIFSLFMLLKDSQVKEACEIQSNNHDGKTSTN